MRGPSGWLPPRLFSKVAPTQVPDQAPVSEFPRIHEAQEATGHLDGFRLSEWRDSHGEIARFVLICVVSGMRVLSLDNH